MRTLFIAESPEDRVTARTPRELYLKIRDGLSEYLCDYVGDSEGRVIARVNYTDNLICHFFVSYGLNYTVGYPRELLHRNPQFDSVKRLSSYWWNIAAAVVGVSPKSIEEMLDLLVRLGSFCLEEAQRSQEIAALEEVMTDETVEEMRKSLGAELRQVWTALIEGLRHHDQVYRPHWETVREFVREVAKRQERVCNGARRR